MASFLGQMDVSDLVQQRRHLRRAAVLQCLLKVQGLFATKYPDEKEDTGVTADEAQDRPEYPGAAPHPGYVFTRAVDEFLEHLDVIAFVGQLEIRYCDTEEPFGNLPA